MADEEIPFERHYFNAAASNLLAIDRHLPDKREQGYTKGYIKARFICLYIYLDFFLVVNWDGTRSRIDHIELFRSSLAFTMNWLRHCCEQLPGICFSLSISASFFWCLFCFVILNYGFSIIVQTPADLLAEIILVDDASSIGFWFLIFSINSFLTFDVFHMTSIERNIPG